MTPEERMLDYEVNPPQFAQMLGTIGKVLAAVILIGALVDGLIYRHFVVSLLFAGIAYCTLRIGQLYGSPHELASLDATIKGKKKTVNVAVEYPAHCNVGTTNTRLRNIITEALNRYLAQSDPLMTSDAVRLIIFQALNPYLYEMKIGVLIVRVLDIQDSQSTEDGTIYL